MRMRKIVFFLAFFLLHTFLAATFGGLRKFGAKITLSPRKFLKQVDLFWDDRAITFFKMSNISHLLKNKRFEA